MNYENSLKAFRRAILETATGREAPDTETNAFIPSRPGTEAPTETTEDLMAKGANWISEIKKASLEYKKAYEASRPKSIYAPSPLEAALSGFTATQDAIKAKKEAEAIPEKEAFIAKRSDSSPSTYAPKRPTEITSFKDAIDLTEGAGNYDTLFGHSQQAGKAFSGAKVSEMTIGDLKSFADPSGKYGQWVKGKVGRVATPMGRYQFVGSTMKQVAKEMGLSDDTVFTPEVQDAMFEHYLGKRISSGKTMDDKVASVREGWEGFKSVPTATLKRLINQYEGT